MTENKTKTHTQYKLANGEKIPSVTTVINSVLSKPALINWAWKMGKEGLDYRTVRDAMGDVGTLAHHLILSHLKGVSPDTSAYSQETIDLAENSYLSYLEWEKHHTLKPVVLETPLVSETLKVGGTPDYYGYVDDELVLIDYKTGKIMDYKTKKIYKEPYIQTCTYCRLIRENDFVLPEKIIILGIPRGEDEVFEPIVLTNIDLGVEIFSHCLSLYNLLKEMP